MENEKQTTETKAQKNKGACILIILIIATIIGVMIDSSKEPITNQYAETFSGDIEAPENAKWIGPFFDSGWEPMTGNQQN